MSRFVVSNYQMSILMEAEKKGITLKRMFEFKQGTAGSVFRRGFLMWREDVERFIPTQDCLDLLEAYRYTVVTRIGITRPLSKYIQNRNINRRVAKGSQ